MMADSPTTMHGAPIYTDPPTIKLRPKGVCGMAWCAPDDPEGVEYVPAAALADLRAEVERRETDIRILLAQLDYLREVTGEGVEEEDAALVAEIRGSLPALSPPPANEEAAE